MDEKNSSKFEVLVVDDDAELRPLLSRGLERPDRTLTFVGTVAGARALASGPIQFDVALVDKGLPDGSGLALIETLKELQPAIEVILITGYGSLDSALAAIAAGAYDYVLKPFDSIPALNLKVQGAIERSRMRVEREQLLKQLSDSDKRYRGLFEASSDAIVVATVDGERITDANPAAAQLYGYNLAELQDLCLDELRTERPTGMVLQGYQHTSWHRRRDGTRFPVDVARGEVAIDGRPHVMLTIRDATEREKSEHDRLEFTMHLQQAHKMEALRRLAGGVAHDFNDLLVIILSNTDNLLEELDLKTEPRARLNEILATAQRATGLTKQLLTFSRHKVAETHLIDPNRAIFDLLPLLRPLLGETMAVTTSLEPNLWQIRLDEDQLGQMLFNLAINARDAMGGRGDVFIETENIEFEDVDDSRLAGVDPGPYVCLSVSDAGPGIDPDSADRIFEPFFTTREDEADGLGLAVVYGIAQQAGGNVKAYSERGVGTTLKVYFPAQEVARTTKEAPEQPGISPQRRTETVLLAEDEHGVRSVIARMLAKQGFNVLEAADGRAALDILNSGPRVDLVVTDIVMPNMTGDELAAAVRRIQPTAKILLMSGYTRDLVLKQGLAGQQLAFIQKPFTPTKFLKRVLKLFDTGK